MKSKSLEKSKFWKSQNFEKITLSEKTKFQKVKIFNRKIKIIKKSYLTNILKIQSETCKFRTTMFTSAKMDTKFEYSFTLAN